MLQPKKHLKDQQEVASICMYASVTASESVIQC